MKVVKSTFDPEILRSIETLNRNEALDICKGLIEGTATKAPKKQALLRDIAKAPTSKEMSRIMWNVLLAGEGLSTMNSKWQARF
jgi:hypothetical protein